jgi:hypothetical protein
MTCNIGRRLLFAKAKVARVAVLLATYHALVSTLHAQLFVLYRVIERLGLLQAFAANRCFKLVA